MCPSPEVRQCRGWILQQFLKLNADTVVEQDHYLVVDADTVMLRPCVFMKPSFWFYLRYKLKRFFPQMETLCPFIWMNLEELAKTDLYLVNTQWDYQARIKRLTTKILGNKKCLLYDFVPHHMLFSKKILQQMKNHIGKRLGQPWHAAILKILKDENREGDFSEYDIYTTYLMEFSGARCRLVSNANILVHRNLLDRLEKIIPIYGCQYKTITMHHDTHFP